MYLIVGLGNIGKEYNLTRHNIGFEVIDYLSNKFDIPVNKSDMKGSYGKGIINGEKVILLKPETYMNLSGECVRLYLDYYNIEEENLFVIYDDKDLDLGVLRIRKKGSAGSHNGMKNIIYCIDTDSFPRFRIGIGKAERSLKHHVLSKFTEEEIDTVKEAVANASDAIVCALKNGVDVSMNQFNKKKKKEEENVQQE